MARFVAMLAVLVCLGVPAACVGRPSAEGACRAFLSRLDSIAQGKDHVTVPTTEDFDNFTDSEGQFLVATLDFSRALSVDDLPGVSKFAESPDAGDYRCLFARALIERDRVDLAARALVADAVQRESVTSYRIWKWWHYSFEMRPDFADLSRRIGDALFNEFANGTRESRSAIARIFGKEPSAAEISAAEFRALVESPATTGK